jgi:protein SCO1/2
MPRMLIGCILTSLALAQPGGILSGPVGRPSTLQPKELKGVGFDQRLTDQLPLELAFRDETGRVVRLGEYFGAKPVIIAPVYYECPMLCSQILGGLTTALKAVKFDPGRDFDVIAASFDPAEHPEQAAAKKKLYTARYGKPGTENGWHFLTGDPKAIEALTGAMGFRYTYDPKTKQFAHASGLLIATPEGRISRYFYGVEYVARDLRLGLVEASANKIASPIDQVLLYCFHYDPATAKYTSIVINILRLAGAATVLALGAMILVFLRLDARARRRAYPGAS